MKKSGHVSRWQYAYFTGTAVNAQIIIKEVY